MWPVTVGGRQFVKVGYCLYYSILLVCTSFARSLNPTVCNKGKSRKWTILLALQERKSSDTTRRVDEEIESSDEETVIQTNQRDVIAQSEEYSEITMSHGIKKSMNIEEIYDAVMVPPATSVGLISTEKEDTGRSSGYEEGSNGSLNQSTTKPPENASVCSCNQKKAINSTQKQSVDENATTKPSQKGMRVVAKCHEYATVAMNQKPRRVKVLEEIYDVIVNQLATRKASSPTPLHVEPYAMFTLPALSVTPGNQCAVGKDSPVASDDGYKHSKVASNSTLTLLNIVCRHHSFSS